MSPNPYHLGHDLSTREIRIEPEPDDLSLEVEPGEPAMLLESLRGPRQRLVDRRIELYGRVLLDGLRVGLDEVVLRNPALLLHRCDDPPELSIPVEFVDD